MALSNIAVPKYYGKFRDAVIRGEIPVCREIEMEMYRIDDLIADPDIYYDDQAVEGFIKYCENELTLTDGSDLKLLDSFKVWAEQIFGWYEFEEERVYVPYDDGYGGRYVTKVKKKRLINKQYLIVARGAAKSMYGSCLQNFFLNVDVTTTHQITTAPTMKQAEEVLSPIRTAITRSRGPFYKFLTDGSLQNTTGSKANRMKLSSTKKGIENFLTGSLLEVRPMRIDKLQGLQLKMATVDEWLSGDIREDVIGAIEQGASKVEDYLIVAISSEGTVRNGAGDTIKMELMDILKGDYINPHVSIWWYKLDSVDEVGDPDKWIKANPNIGKTVSYETYQRDVDRAEKAPAARNDILAKRFGLPMEGYTYYFTYEETLPHRKREYWQMPCSLGADLSQGDDFCAFTFLFPLSNGSFGVKTRNYISSLTLMKLIPAMRTKYDQFIKEGSLIVLEGTVLDMMDVYEDLDNHIVECRYDVRSFGYDPYNAKEFVERWSNENGPFGIEKVIQGARTESVPLGELKTLSEERMLLFDEELMTFTMGNCITLEDTNGNRKLLKKRLDHKIDAVAAMLDAYVASLSVLSKAGGFGALLGGTGMLVAVQSLDEISQNLERLGNLSWDQIGHGLTAMGGALGEFTVALSALSAVGGFGSLLGGTGILVAVQSLDEISENLKKLGTLSWEEIGKGLVGMGGALAELGTVLGLLGSLGGFGSVFAGGAILLGVQGLGDLADALKKFGGMTWDEITKGLVGMGGSLTELAVVSGLLGNLGGLGALIGSGSLLLGVYYLSTRQFSSQRTGAICNTTETRRNFVFY